MGGVDLTGIYMHWAFDEMHHHCFGGVWKLATSMMSQLAAIGPDS